MASDVATIHHILGLLDRHSFKTIEHAVQQFNDHKQRFRESLSDLKSLKPPTGGDLLNIFTHPTSHGMQARCTPLKPQARCTPLKPPTGDDFLNVSSHPSPHVMQARCTPLKPPLSSTFVQRGIENHGSKQYTLRPRAARKLSTLGAPPQRVTRSRAKQPAISTAAACNISTKTDFMVLEDDFVEIRAKVDRKPEQHQQVSSQGEAQAEATTSGCCKAYSNQSLEHECHLQTSSQDVIATTTAPKQPVLCKRELLTPSSLKSLKNLEKEGFSSGAPAISLNSTEQYCLLSPHLAQQIRLSKIGNLVTPRRSPGNCNLHAHSEAPIMGTGHRSSSRSPSIDTGAAVLAKPPTMCVRSPTLNEQAPKETNDAIQYNAKQETQFPTNAEDGPHVVCPTEDDALGFQGSLITVKSSPSSAGKKILEMNARQSGSRKRKLSICGGSIGGIVADNYHNARKRYCSTTISRNSIELEAFKFDGDDVLDEVRRPVSERVSTPENMESATVKESRIRTVETFLGGITNCVVSEGLCGEAHYEVAGGDPNAWDSQDLRCVLKDIHEGKPAFRNSFQVTTQEVHQACEKIEPCFDSTKDTHMEESNCDDRPKTPEKQGVLVLELTLADQPLVSDMDSSPVHLSTRLQPEQEKEMGSSSKSDLLLTISLQGVDPRLHELAEDELTLRSGVTTHSIEELATGTTANLPPQELASSSRLPAQEKAVDKVMFSHTRKSSKSDVLRSPELKVIAQDCMPLSPGMRRSPELKVIAQDCMPLSPGMRRSPASNSIEQMKSNLLLSATKSILKYHVNGVSCDESTPSVNAKGGFESLSITAFGPTSSAVKETVSADKVLVGTDIDSCKENADIVLVGTDVDSCKEKGSAGNVLVVTDIDNFKEKAATDNVLVGTDVDSHSLHIKVNIDENILHDMEEKTFFSMKSEVGTCTHLGCTSVEQIISRCDFASGEPNEVPRRVTSSTKAGSQLKLDEGAWIANVTISSCLASTDNLHSCKSASKNANEDALPSQALELENCNRERSSKIVSMGPNSTAHISSPIFSLASTDNLRSCKSASKNANEDALPAQALELENSKRERSSKIVSLGQNSTVHISSPILSLASTDNLHSCISASKNANEDALPAQALELETHNRERSSKAVSVGPNSAVHINSPNLSSPHGVTTASKMACVMPSMKKTENCCREIKLEMPCSEDTECEPPGRPEIYDYEESTSKGVSFGAPSPSAVKDDLQGESSIGILNMETKERTAYKTDDGDDISDTGSQMDCSETPNSSVRRKEIKDKSAQFNLENEATTELKVTPKGDEAILNFSKILAQGTVSSRRKRPRSPANLSEESFKDFKKMKISSIEKGEQIIEGRLPHTFLSSFEKSSSPMYSFPHIFSPVRGLQGTFGMTFNDSPCAKLHDSGGFDSLQRQIKGSSNKLCKSYSRLSALRKEYLDTPHFRSARADLVDGTSTKYEVQKSEWHLDTHVEEDGKENQTPEPWLRGKSYCSTNIISEKQAPANTRTVLGRANQSLGQLDGLHKSYNLAAVETRSFLDLIQQKQQPLPYPNGKREVRVKALEAAELARRQEEKRENERKMRRLDCNEAKSTELECSKDKMIQGCALTMAGKGVTDKVKRVAELKMKMDQEKARKQEVDQRKKEEERKKKELELADKKRKREDADKREREDKRKRVEEVQRLRKEQEERQRLELNEKEHKRKMLEERERGKKAQEEEAKRQRRLEKEKEAERRRKQEEHLKAARFAEKQAERKRKEAMLQARGCEDDHISQLALGNKLSFLSTESFAVSTSADWEPQSKNTVRTRSQVSEDRWGLRVPSLSTSAYCHTNNKKLSTSVFSVENGTKQVAHEAGFKCEPFTGLRSQYFTPHAPARVPQHESEIQSYEISPYKSSSDDDGDDEDDQPKKPIPIWARKENLLPQILWQQCIDPDNIFSSEKTCSLGEIFGTTGSRRCKNFMQRSTSGDWLDDLTTKVEELDYKKAMGYIQD